MALDIKTPTKRVLKDHYRALQPVLAAARRDPDVVTMLVDATESDFRDSDIAVFAVKGRKNAVLVFDALEDLGLVNRNEIRDPDEAEFMGNAHASWRVRDPAEDDFRHASHYRACQEIDVRLFSGDPGAAELARLALFMRRWRKLMVDQWKRLGQDAPIRVYIAGPMTGYPDHNIPAFRDAAERLRALDYIVLCPVEINGETEGEPGQWAPCMRQDLPAVMECDVVALLPGWERSRGATLEQACAVQVGIPCIPFEQFLTATGRSPVHNSSKEN